MDSVIVVWIEQNQEMTRWCNFMNSEFWQIMKCWFITVQRKIVKLTWCHDGQIIANKSYFTLDLKELILTKCSLFQQVQLRKISHSQDEFLSPKAFGSQWERHPHIRLHEVIRVDEQWRHSSDLRHVHASTRQRCSDCYRSQRGRGEPMPWETDQWKASHTQQQRIINQSRSRSQSGHTRDHTLVRHIISMRVYPLREVLQLTEPVTHVGEERKPPSERKKKDSPSKKKERKKDKKEKRKMKERRIKMERK